MIVFIVIFYFLLIFIPTIRTLFDASDDRIAQQIIEHIHQHHIPLELTEKIIADDAGSMSSTYYGILRTHSDRQHSVVVKYSSFKSIWNYVHASEFNRLYDEPCRTHIDSQRNQFLVMRDDKDRIVTERWIPAEIYVAFQAYFCSHLMPAAPIVSPVHSYFSFFQSIEQPDDQRSFFVIYRRLNDGISLKRFLQQNRDRLMIEQTKHWIYQILEGVLKLKSMSIIHLDLNSGNIFLMHHPHHQHPIVFIDFAIMKFIHSYDPKHVFYSETLHQSLYDLYLNCPSCQSSNVDLPPFARPFDNSFKTLTIEALISHPWLFSSSSHRHHQ